MLPRKNPLFVWSGIVCVFVALGLVAAHDAEACSPPQPEIGWISVADGATGLPTNVSFWVTSRFGFGDRPFKYKLTGPDGAVAVTEAKARYVQVKPGEALKPNTTYTLEVSCQENRCANPKQVKKVSFTTGAGPWKDAAAYAGGTIATSKYFPKKVPQNSCESGAPERFVVTVEGPKNERAAYYTLSRVEAPDKVLVYSENPKMTATVPFSDAGKSVCFYLRSVDHAGNNDKNTTKVCVTPKKDGTTISEPVTDGGTGFDGSTNLDGGTNHDSTKPDGSPEIRVGCSALQGNDGLPALGAFLLLLFLGGIRRRRRF